MAESPSEYDFIAFLSGVWEDLLDYMDLVTVLEELKKSEVFRPSTLRDLQEKHPTTNEKISALLQLVKDGGYIRYVQFKQCLGSSGQEHLVEKLEATERGEYKPVQTEEEKSVQTEEDKAVQTEEEKSLQTEEEKLLEVLTEDLIEYYREKESTMSVAPLVQQHEARITKFYVRPPMMAYNKPNAFGQKKQSDEKSEEQSDEKSKEKKSEEKTRIRSYWELLLNGNDPYRQIYVTADAGMGKTSFSKMLAVMWYEAHASKYKSLKIKSKRSFPAALETILYVREIRSPVRSDADSFDTEDISAMEKFDFLFLIKLREYGDSNKCSLHEMIFEKLIPKLQHKCRYTREFLENTLCNKRCLIIVDGLDEWTHPKSCGRQEVIPHRKQWPRCTVLTTTRPWKLSSAQLSGADVDRQVEISPLDETTARKLESRAIEILNENQGRQTDQVAVSSNTKTETDFENSVPKKILAHILYIPFVLLQMICLWFENSPIGKSLCEVYSNIIELTLTRWLVKTDSRHTDCECEPPKEHENIKLKCMGNNRHCQCYMPLLLKIGELAFSTLFNVIREESLLFDRKHLLKYLKKEELKQCLEMGLLSQVKDTSSLSELRLQLHFPHKTLHEFFCALFIATNWSNVDTGTISIKQIISNKCTSVSDILEMSDVFIFVCGLNPEVYSEISRHLATIVSTNQSVIDYRNCVKWNADLLEKYQRMQISCLLESTRNQHPECKILIEDVFVGRSVLYGQMKEDESQALERILPDSACSMKSLTLNGVQSAEGIVRILQHAEFPCLERLRVQWCELTLFQSILASAAHTLGPVSLTDDMCSAVSRLDNLQGFDISNVTVSSESLISFSDCICGCMSLQKLRLDLSYKLSDKYKNLEQCEASIKYLLKSIEAKTLLTYLSLDIDVRVQNCVLNISRLNKLQVLYLHLRLTELHINTEQLVWCYVSRMYGFSAPAVSSLLAELHGAPVLENLTLGYIRTPPPRIDITELPRLMAITLGLCDLGDSSVTLSSEMTSLKTITLRKTRVNIPCCSELFLSISKLPQHITVKLQEIKMTVREWRKLLFDILGKLPKSIHVEMGQCTGPSEEEWRNIFDDMKASPAFCVPRTYWGYWAYNTFDTVVVRGRLLKQMQYI